MQDDGAFIAARVILPGRSGGDYLRPVGVDLRFDEIKIDGDTYLIMREDDILGIIG